jgi:hypothetical protein
MKISMTIMRPPQHGHGWGSAFSPSGSALWLRFGSWRVEQLSRLRDILFTTIVGE